MKRFFVLGCALIALAFVCQGCASPDGKGFFDEAIKDWNGDNMKMRGFGSEAQP